ncbi:MAG: response regulator, partial [Desulfobacteraceae bacterium]|nr:response regulator [Desulfobacteraceae bacterium]
MDYHPHILIVEDDKLWIDNCRRALKDHRVEIKDAMRAQDAIDLIQKDCFAAVFVDLEIPGMKECIYGGFEVLESGRDLNPYTEMVVITEHEEDEVLSRVREHDVLLCIRKPVD